MMNPRNEYAFVYLYITNESMADLGDFGVVGGGRRRSPGDSAGFMSRARRLLSSSYFIHVSTPHFVMWLYDCCWHFCFLEFFRLTMQFVRVLSFEYTLAVRCGKTQRKERDVLWWSHPVVHAVKAEATC